MQSGDTFFLSKASADVHLWLVLSDPAQDPTRVLLVSLTSHDRQSDPACVIEPGEHPFVRHRTAVAFDKVRQASDVQLNALASSGSLLVNEPLTSALLAKLRLAAARSRRLERGHWHLLDEQGLLPE